MRIYRKQTRRINTNEAKVINRLQQHGVEYKTQTPIPILSSGGKLEHLYLADIVVGKTIIEVDGPQHKKSYDKERDRQTSSLGYKTIRIPTSDLSEETIDSYLRELY
jgi:very-short-patch-repair endonuclease